MTARSVSPSTTGAIRQAAARRSNTLHELLAEFAGEGMMDVTSALGPFLDLGEALLGVGDEVNHVEDLLVRMGHAYGAASMNVFALESTIVMTMILPTGESLTQSRRVIRYGDMDYTKLELLSNLGERCCSKPMDGRMLAREVAAILRIESPSWRVYLGSMLGTGFFCVFFGGSPADAVVAALIGALMCWAMLHAREYCANTYVFNLLVSLVAGVLACLLSAFIPGLDRDTIIIGDIMLIVPGVAMTNAVRDILDGATATGALRFLETLLWAAALAFGFMISLMLVPH